MILRNPTTILVLGTDSRLGEPARSDTIMLMRFDPDTHTVNQLSIPRDTKVEVPGRGTMKINEAMFWGGSVPRREDDLATTSASPSTTSWS